MKLRAKILKDNGKVFKVAQPKGAHNLPDSMITRHIGPRPWTETFYYDDNSGMYVKGYYNAQM